MKIGDNNLAVRNPELAKQWHLVKNEHLTPHDVKPKSHKAIWWVCDKGHEWQANICDRTGGDGCPYCSGHRACEDNCLQNLRPDIAKQWHTSKNEALTPNDVTEGSNKKVWWQCEKGHEWITTVYNRTKKGTGCPYCIGKLACLDNCLQTLFPDISKQWHPIKNKILTPYDVTTGSGKKVWWLCEKGHEWDASISNRVKGDGCPYCSGQRAGADNCLHTLYPTLSKQWNYELNRNLTPHNVTAHSNRKVWWRCAKGHEWQAHIVNRTIHNSNCPYCSGQRACEDNSLKTLNPELAKQWHPSENGDLTPNDVTTGSKKVVWWLCDLGHEWKAAIHSRSSGVGCPICNQSRQTSFPEQALYFYIKAIFDDAENRYKYDAHEIDVFIPSINVGIEYDGLYYHSNNENDAKKEAYLFGAGVRFLRLKEIKDAEADCFYENNVIYLNAKSVEKHLVSAIQACFEYISKNITLQTYTIDIDIERDRVQIYDLYMKGEEASSLFALYPELSQQWHSTKNLKLKPNMVSRGSDKIVWWQCENGHEWRSRVGNRVRGNGCPYCSGRRICADNCLSTVNPELSKQWHLTKNDGLSPNDVTPNSNKNVWWKCERGHEWKSTVYNRTIGRGCPYCSGRYAHNENSLQAISPDLAKQWHPSKNGEITPLDVTSGTDKKYWWICDKGHEWKVSVNNRMYGRNCPYCGGKRVNKDNCLNTLKPELAKQWHPTKNNDLSPTDVTLGSGKKVWWACEKGHEWITTVANRARTGCPHCHKIRRTKVGNS